MPWDLLIRNIKGLVQVRDQTPDAIRGQAMAELPILTNAFLAIKDNLKIANKKSLFVLPVENNNIYLSSRNVHGVEVVIASELSTYKIMNANSLVLFEGSLEGIETNLSK